MFQMLGVIRTVLLFVSLSVSAWIDWKKQKVYLSLVVITIMFGILLHIFLLDMTITDILFGGLIGGILLFLGCLTGEQIGYGDGCIFIMTGIYLGGLKNLMLFFIASLLAGGYAVFLLLIRKRTKKDCVAYVPFVLLAYIILIIYPLQANPLFP